MKIWHCFGDVIVNMLIIIDELREFSIRLGISYPELTEMQVRAIFEAAISVSKQGIKVFPEIMVPLIGTPQV